MVTTCVVRNCTSASEANCGTSFHRFPEDKALREQWKNNLKHFKKKNFDPTPSSRVCSKHFVEDNYELKPNSKRKRLKFDAVPPEIDDEPEPPAKRIRTANVDELRKTVRSLRQQLRRKNNSLVTAKSIIKTMKEKKLITNDTKKLIIEKFKGVTRELVQNQLKNQCRKNTGKRYTDEIKKFSLTLHFYSPQAYEFVKQYIVLPDQRSLSYWTSTVNCEPGTFKDVFDYLSCKASNGINYKDCCLILDGIHLKSGLIYNHSTGNYEGYVSYGENIVCIDEDKEATEALVFMLVGLRGHWKVPIGYVLINGITGENLYIVLRKFLQLTFQNNIKIHSVTADGTSVNMTCMKKFGCKIGDNFELLSGEFVFEGHTLYFTPDPSHMLKLARNALADIKILLDIEGNIIDWDHIKILQSIQQEEGLKFANKLSKGHVNFHRHKMNVKIAAQTLSSSVAYALEYLMNAGHPELQNAKGTIQFLRVIDKIFDLLNSRSIFGKGYKRPLCLGDRSRWSSTIDKTIEYFKGLKKNFIQLYIILNF